jgi:hypothetical protein
VGFLGIVINFFFAQTAMSALNDNPIPHGDVDCPVQADFARHNSVRDALPKHQARQKAHANMQAHYVCNNVRTNLRFYECTYESTLIRMYVVQYESTLIRMYV